MRNFRPAQIAEIDELTVSGTSGAASPCPNCLIELFLDDTDLVTEALQSLALATADQDGDWTVTLTAPLEAEQGLRTTSTVPDDWTITDLEAGTTSNLSALYREWPVFLPLVRRN